MRYQDQAVLVTGGGSGIGQPVCFAAAREGARVAIGDRNLERAEQTASTIRATSADAQAFALDVVDPVSVNTFIATAETTLGRLDVLVNSADLAAARHVVPLARRDSVLARPSHWRVMGKTSPWHGVPPQAAFCPARRPCPASAIV